MYHEESMFEGFEYLAHVFLDGLNASGQSIELCLPGDSGDTAAEQRAWVFRSELDPYVFRDARERLVADGSDGFRCEVSRPDTGAAKGENRVRVLAYRSGQFLLKQSGVVRQKGGLNLRVPALAGEEFLEYLLRPGPGAVFVFASGSAVTQRDNQELLPFLRLESLLLL